MRAENCSESVEVSILLTDDENIRRLNREYRGIDAPTDVLSFSQFEGGEAIGPAAPEGLLGDVVISVETARRQAMDQGHSLEEEIDVLLVHGILHLLGYDHAEPREAESMFARQSEIVRGLRV